VTERLLGVWAHPDDEAYLSAGLMARVVEAGGTVTVLTATRGEQGASDPTLAGSAAFGHHRARELAASLAVLGVHEVKFLGLADGGCDMADDETQIRQILDAIVAVNPDAVVTFGPDGITNHPDHRAVSRWTTEAWRRGPGGALRYAALTHDNAERFAGVTTELGVFADFSDRRPVTISRDQVALGVSLSDSEVTRKRRALAAHGSQTDGLAAQMGEDTYRIWFREETFRAPTAAEVYRCELPAWHRSTPESPRELVGASA
jgi:LmbE family N-acetylglucosaminyl deacetylase